MGALLHPSTQNDLRIVAAGLCTQDQYDTGKEEFFDRLLCHYEQKNPSPQVTNASSTNECSKNDLLDGKSTPLKKAEEEFLYLQYMYVVYLPKEIKHFLVLGAMDNKGDPQDHVIYTIDPVVKKSQSTERPQPWQIHQLSGHYDPVNYLDNHQKDFLAIHEIGTGHIFPHIST